jgi:exodeoxyribonuclease VII large subunit
MADATGLTNAPRVIGVAALLLAASDALQARLGAVVVRGELSGFTRAASGHCYFTLKDADGAPAVLRCAMFRRAAALLEFEPRDGQQVELRGRMGIYEPRGELQCVAEAMLPLGAGSLYEQFLRRKAQLEAAGLFDPSRKRAIARFPQAVGVVSSTAGAALHDVLTTFARRAPHVRVVVYPSAVQGSEAPAQLVQAITVANARAEVDTLIVCRGGGSIEDLWSFNDEQVVRAIAGSALPVVCGVGHETDVTLADLAADLRAPTPTAAAELAAPQRNDELQRLADAARSIDRALQRQLQRQGQRLDIASARLGAPAARVQQLNQRLLHLQQRSLLALRQRARLQAQGLDAQAQRLRTAVRGACQSRQEQWLRMQQRLAALDPRRTLQRGFAWIHDDQGRVVTRASGLHEGQTIGAVWADGEATAQVRSVRRQPLAE